MVRHTMVGLFLLASATACSFDSNSPGVKPASPSLLLPETLACSSLRLNVDLQPALGVTEDGSFDGDCFWLGPESRSSSKYLSLRLIPDLPATFEEADAALDISKSATARNFNVKQITAPDWTYGVIRSGIVENPEADNAGAGSVAANYYYVDSSGMGIDCQYTVGVGLDYTDADAVESAYLRDWSAVGEKTCSLLLKEVSGKS